MTAAAAAAAGNRTYSLILYYLCFLFKKNKTFLHAPPHLPFELVEEILCRLPVKHLLQLCCVCKSWNSLISHDSKFAKKHLRFSTFRHDRHHLALICSHGFRIYNSPISSFFSFSSKIFSFSSKAASTYSFTHFNHPLLKHKKDYDSDVSTCHGMLCFGIDESLALLCNPSIRKFKPLPPLINSGPRYSKTLYTLVYDRFIDNYKIIALSFSSCHNDNKREVNVHTLGTDYWRKIQDFPNHNDDIVNFFSMPQGIFVCDTVNWLVPIVGERFETFRIISLDLEKELYQELLRPLFDESSFPHYDLGVLRDCLCVFSHISNFSDIWIMKEYGNEKSWTKLFRVPYIGTRDFHVFTQPLYIHEDDRVLMMLVKMSKFIFTVYNSKNNTFKTRQIQNNFFDWEISKVHVDSLISPY